MVLTSLGGKLGLPLPDQYNRRVNAPLVNDRSS
jgi:hypothetical protein